MQVLLYMQKILQDSQDLMPDHPVAVFMAGLWGMWSVVEPKLMIGAALLFFLNVIVSYWLEFRTDGQYGEVFWLSLTRFVGYVIAGLMVTIFSWMLDGVDVLHRIIWGGMGGVEVAVGLGMLARLIPRFRPIWREVVKWVDDNTPLNMTVGRVDSIINKEQNRD